MENPQPATLPPAQTVYQGEWGEVFDYFPWLKYNIAGVDAWLWVVIPALFIGSYLLARLVISFLLLVADTLGLIKRNWLQRYLLSVTSPLALLIAAIMFNGAQGLLPIADATEDKLSYFNSAIYTVAITWIVIVYVDSTLEAVRRRLMRQGRATSSALIPLLRKIANAAIVTLAVLFLLQNLGFDVAALIAALGIGGIAIALASQKSVENLLGGIMISLDQPVRIGDFGKFGGILGRVEDIGLRSTKIRTLERTILSIPNAEMAGMQLENYTARDMIAFRHILGLRYETSVDQIRYIVTQIRDLLLAHPMINNDKTRVRFIKFGDFTLDIEITAYIRTGDMDKGDEVQEDLLLRIKDIVSGAGSDFAYPSQTLYMERGAGIDTDRQKEIDEKVRQLHQSGELQWPNPTALHAQEITDTLDYPAGAAKKN